MKGLSRALLVTAMTMAITACGTIGTVVDKTAELVEDTKALVKKALPSDRLEWPSGDGVSLYQIDDAGSMVEIKVYREGRLAKLGHNHVIEAKKLRGRAAVKRDFEDSAFELQSALSDWVIDSPEARKRAGDGFSSAPSPSDIESTRRNMLGEKGLQADRFPVLSISGNVEEKGKGQVLNATVRLHGVDKSLDIPVSLIKGGGQMRVIGEFAVKQSDFEVEPLSLMFGALRVRDEVDIQFSVLLKAK